MALRRIRLELARSREFPEGSATHGYEFVAPLDGDGHFDAAGWKHAHKDCWVRRFWGNEPEEDGFLIHTRARNWAFSYEPGDDDDEPIFKFDRHTIKAGDYISVTEHDGVQRTFRIASVN